MPEIVEVRKIKDFLKKIMKNKYIESINILKGRYKTHKPFELYYKLKNNLPLKVLEIKTKGKFMYFILEDDFYIFSTLGLTGGWIKFLDKKNFKKDDKKVSDYKFPVLFDNLSKEIFEKYHKTSINNLNVEFKMSDSTIVYYYDSLSFGTLKVIDNKEDLEKKLNQIGPDIMEETTTIDIFINNVTKEKNLDKYIGNVIMNQKVISGVGNYLRSDILWLSRISPFRKVKDLSKAELNTIYNNSRKLTWGEYDLKKGIKNNIIQKKDIFPRDFNRNFFVYICKKDIYDNVVVVEKLYEGSVERRIYWCPKYQK
jgi:formamidopyrimidine-DNA glycosylase